MGATVLDFRASLVPIVIRAFPGIADAHAVRVQRVRLGEVYDPECHCLLLHALWYIDGEVEPLVVAARVCVHSHVQIVIVGFRLNNHIEVSRFEGRVKD